MKRTIEVSTRGLRLYREQNLLHVAQGTEVLGKIPFEDIGVLILDSNGLSLTTGAITALLENGAAIVFCGKGHHPEGVLVPLTGNTTHTQRFRAQVKATRPLNKNLWKNIVRSKVQCQKALLPKGPVVDRLTVIQNGVRSGDPTNAEAQAARAYWPALFGSNFRRNRQGDGPNSLLNYGYILLRSATARAITATGLSPALGIHHRSKYNPFCLADDLMEPFRPWVDARVLQLHQSGKYEIDQNAKHHLLQVLTDRVIQNDEEGPLLSAIERTAASLSKAYLTFLAGDQVGSAKDVASGLILPQGFPRAA